MKIRKQKLKLTKPLYVRGKRLDQREIYIIQRKSLFSNKIINIEISPLEGLHERTDENLPKEFVSFVSSLKKENLNLDELNLTRPFFNLIDERKCDEQLLFTIEDYLLKEIIMNFSELIPFKLCHMPLKVAELCTNKEEVLNTKENVVKIKIRPDSFEKNIEIINAANENKNIKLIRIDGNQHLNPNETLKIWRNIDQSKIDFFEEPTKETIKSLPWAYDEKSKYYLNHPSEIEDNVKALVIKPGVNIHLHEILDYFSRGSINPQAPLIFSGYFQGSIGLFTSVFLSRIQNSIKYICTGLGTYKYIDGLLSLENLSE